MIEIVILLAVGAAPVWLGLAAWRLRCGPAGSYGRRTGRMLAVLVIAAGLLGLPIYRLVNSRTFQLAGKIVPRIETEAPVVALTFDDGPTPEMAAQILPVLRAAGVRATFFVTGDDVRQNMAVAQELVGEGHELGNHTYSHVQMVFKSAAVIGDEIERTDALIREAGYDGEILFRAPYCKKLLLLPLYLARTGRPNIIWDVEPDSYPDVAGDPDRIANYVVSHARPGSIVLLHPWSASGQADRAALPKIIEGLQARGLRFVTASELLSKMSYDLRRE